MMKTEIKTTNDNLENIIQQSEHEQHFYQPSRNCGRKYIYDLMNNEVKERLSKK